MCNYQLQPQIPLKCWSRSCSSGLCFLSPSGPRRRILLALLPSSLFSLPNPPESPSNYYNSMSIFSRDKLLMGKTSRLRTSGAAGFSETLLSDSQGKFIRGEGYFWIQVQDLWGRNKIWEEKKTHSKWALGVWTFFFFLRGGRLGFFVCLWVWFFAGLFCAYLWNGNNWN